MKTDESKPIILESLRLKQRGCRTQKIQSSQEKRINRCEILVEYLADIFMRYDY